MGRDWWRARVAEDPPAGCSRSPSDPLPTPARHTKASDEYFAEWFTVNFRQRTKLVIKTKLCEVVLLRNAAPRCVAYTA